MATSNFSPTALGKRQSHPAQAWAARHLAPSPAKLQFNISTRAQGRHHNRGLSYKQQVLTRAPSTADKLSYVFHAFSLTLSDTFRASQRTTKSASPISSLGKAEDFTSGGSAQHTAYIPDHGATRERQLPKGAPG